MSTATENQRSKQAVDAASVLLARIAKATERTSMRLAIIELLVFGWMAVQFLGALMAIRGPSSPAP